MHALKNWVDCDDPNCKCNGWLAKQPPIPTDRSFTMGLTRKGPSPKGKRRTKAGRERDAERQKAWREANRERDNAHQRQRRANA